jgi:hypothetical protein
VDSANPAPETCGPVQNQSCSKLEFMLGQLTTTLPPEHMRWCEQKIWLFLSACLQRWHSNRSPDVESRVAVTIDQTYHLAWLDSCLERVLVEFKIGEGFVIGSHNDDSS